jgi:hypothetical protein
MMTDERPARFDSRIGQQARFGFPNTRRRFSAGEHDSPSAGRRARELLDSTFLVRPKMDNTSASFTRRQCRHNERPSFIGAIFDNIYFADK